MQIISLFVCQSGASFQVHSFQGDHICSDHWPPSRGGPSRKWELNPQRSMGWKREKFGQEGETVGRMPWPVNWFQLIPQLMSPLWFSARTACGSIKSWLPGRGEAHPTSSCSCIPAFSHNTHFSHFPINPLVSLQKWEYSGNFCQ